MTQRTIDHIDKDVGARAGAAHPRTITGRVAGLLLAGLLGVGALTACGGGTDQTATADSGSGSATGDAASSAPADADAARGSTDASAEQSQDAGSLRVSWCSSDDLKGTVTEGDGGAAGSSLPYIVFKNTGSEPCRLQGWPGVSLVGGGDGSQVGAAATQDRTSPHATVTLKPNGHAHAPLRVADARNYPKSTCRPQQADGLRVYPPGETKSIFVRASGLLGCANQDVKLLEVQAVQPGVG